MIRLHNKKGIIANPAVWVVAVVAILLVIFILFSRGAFGIGSITSLTQEARGYDKDTCRDIGVVVSGNVNIEDSAVFDLEPSIRDISVDEVLANNKKLLKFGVEQFTYEVEGIDDVANQRLDVFSGSGELKSADNKGISKPYSLNFISKDLNCDAQIDSFNLKIKATLKGKDIGQRAEYEKLVRFRNGRVIR